MRERHIERDRAIERNRQEIEQKREGQRERKRERSGSGVEEDYMKTVNTREASLCCNPLSSEHSIFK